MIQRLFSLTLAAVSIVKAADYGIPAAPPPAPIRVNGVGFPLESTKQATLGMKAEEFSVVEAASGKVVFTGKCGPPVQTAASDTGETLRIADFSGLRVPGRYRLEVREMGKSADFEIGSRVYVAPYKAAARAFYLWRCGCAVKATWDGNFYEQAPCHLGDGLMDHAGGQNGTRRDGTGGWHDAGDYNKYVVNAGVSVGLLYRAWEHFRPAVEKISLEIPESGGGMPDLLAELRYETDWLLKMQAEYGSAYHKLSALNFGYWGRPDKDGSPRYFCPWGSTATADLAAMMALGARHFAPYDSVYAQRCLQSARKAHAFLQNHPEDHSADQQAFNTGPYTCGDASHRLWAAYELWETTGEQGFLKEFEAQAGKFQFRWAGPGWGSVEDLALSGYLLTSRRDLRDPALVSRLTENLLNTARKIVSTARSNAHGRGLGDEKNQFFWGCNGNVAGQTLLLHSANRLAPDPAFRDAAQLCVGHLLGRNYHGRSYVTGIGHNPPVHTHDRRGEPQLPGYLVGGPWPTAREYLDSQPDASRNEIAINWNAAFVYALAGLLEP